MREVTLYQQHLSRGGGRGGAGMVCVLPREEVETELY